MLWLAPIGNSSQSQIRVRCSIPDAARCRSAPRSLTCETSRYGVRVKVKDVVIKGDRFSGLRCSAKFDEVPYIEPASASVQGDFYRIAW